MFSRVLIIPALLALLALPAATGFAAAKSAAPAAATTAPAMTPWQIKTALGDPLVLDNMAVIYAEGRGVPQDYTKAAIWFRKSAEHGDAFAQYSLAYLYMHGQGVPKDFSKAADWYHKAAMQGDVKSEYHLGTLYYLGVGVPKDYYQAVGWFTKAANKGDPEALYYLRRITSQAEATGAARVSGIMSAVAPTEAVDPTKQVSDGLELTGLLGEGVPVGFEMVMVVVIPALAMFGI